MTSVPRVAFLPDTFHEINGVAHTSRQLEAFARRRGLPFMSVHCGPHRELRRDHAVTVSQLERGKASIALDAHLQADPLLMRYQAQVIRQVQGFGAQVVHITGPGDMGILGCWVAWTLRIPLVISWHTALHEYAGRRLEKVLRMFGPRVSATAGHLAEKGSMAILNLFYRRARVILAPNQELVSQLHRMTHRPVFLMRRGVDTHLFSPMQRTRSAPGTFRLGYVGRLTTEKNVRFLASLGQALMARGHTNFEFVLIGQGIDQSWLSQHVPNATLTGVLLGQELAQAYADMDAFVFPSKTDTFGNVVLEALSAGVPAIVTNEGGPKFLVQDHLTGRIAATDQEFIEAVDQLIRDPEHRRRMSMAARQYACEQSWDAVFEKVYDAYRICVDGPPVSRSTPDTLLSSRL